MKLKYSNILISLMIIIIICECNGFRLLRLDDNIYKMIYLMAIIVMLFICLIYIDFLQICNPSGKFIYYYSIMAFLFLIFEYIYTIHLYRNLWTSFEYINYNKYYIFIFLSLPLFYILVVHNNFENLMSVVMLLATVTLGLVLIHALLYQWYQIEFLNISIYAKKLVRNERMRMWDLSSLEGLAIIYGTYRILFVKQKRIRYGIQTFICVTALVYVEQTKMMLIALTASTLLMIIMKPCKTAYGILIKSILVTIVGISGAGLVIPKLITSLKMSVSVSARLIELQFVYNLLQNRGILGIGMISHNVQSYLYYHGIYSHVHLDDIGLVGFIAQAGVWSAPLFIIPMLRMLWILLRAKKNEFSIFLWSIYTYLVITSSTLFVLNSPRILMWPFCLALFEFYNYKINRSKRGNQIC